MSNPTPDERPTVAACQTPVSDLDPEANVATLQDRVAALPDRVEVALFPEQFLTGFVPDDRTAEAAVRTDGAELDAVRDCAADNDVALLVGYVERADETLYNTVAYVRPDGETTVYRKRHLWGGELKVLTPGEERVTVETPLGRTGLVTCYDLNFVADSAAYTEERVDALFVVGAWPAAHSENWRLLVRARALDGVRWAVACGRTGRRDVPEAPTATYGGRSMVARPNGSVHTALADDERDLVVTLDPEEQAYHRKRVGIYRD
ncbi:carbon-nitrogen hydrolase family protein [Haloglomus halophilum]|uniref:carbon-nitrogen hydrolase family protein n=1 Tax=Haloglomus halophilum TaxID=2962672 RepID=UPI0020C9767D|nr:carbon-nitrogen hydrolase family protein [Haloglomus halophilum]